MEENKLKLDENYKPKIDLEYESIDENSEKKTNVVKNINIDKADDAYFNLNYNMNT